MAGLIGLSADDIVIQDALGAIKWEYEGEWVPHPVVRLTTTLPVAVARSGERVVVRARWGFTLGGGRPVGNARDDKLMESRLWAPLLATPCLFAATAVYEQVHKGEKKTSYAFRRVDGSPMVLPGLAGERNVKGEKRLCAAIVTTQPNRFFAKFHNRQVCTLSAKEMAAWMAGASPEEMMGLLHTPAEDEWEAVPVEGVFARGIINEEDIRVVGEPVRWSG